MRKNWDAGITLRAGGRRDTLNRQYFSGVGENTWDEARAYWLGYITGDGCVTNGSLQLGCKSGDRALIEAFAASIGSQNPVVERANASTSFGPNFRHCQWCSYSPEIAADLAAVGIVERKSLIATPWDGPADLMRHYWRGLVDSDGWVFKSKVPKNGVYEWRVGLCGSRAVVEAFAAFAHQHVGVNAKALPVKTIWQVGIGGTASAQALAEILYSDATVYLERKKATADELMLLKCNTRSPERKDLAGEALRTEYEAGASMTDLARKYNTNTPLVLRRLRSAGFTPRKRSGRPKGKVVK